MNEDMYVVITWNVHDGSPEVCYEAGNTPFIGPYEAAKAVTLELKEWYPDAKYKIFKLEEA